MSNEDTEKVLTREERGTMRAREKQLTKDGALRRLTVEEVAELNEARLTLFGPKGKKSKKPAKRPGKARRRTSTKHGEVAPLPFGGRVSGGLPGLGRRR